MIASIKSVDVKSNESSIAYAHELLARCESGEVVSVVALEIKREGKYAVVTTGNPSRFETAGICMEIVNRILNDTE